MKSGPWHIVISMSRKWKDFWLAIGLSILAAFIFFFTAKATMHDFDYTGRIASALLHGHLGLDKRPGSWLNELVPFEGKYYSVFPLGAVLSVLPVALLQQAGWIHSFPAQVLTALIAGLCVFFFFGLSSVGTKSIARRIVLALFPIFGTWTWETAREQYAGRSEEHTSELQSRGHLVCRLLLEKKKQTKRSNI